MNYYLRNAMFTIIWLLCSFQIAQLWFDPMVRARIGPIELVLISSVMVGVTASLHFGIKRVLK